MNYNLRLAAAQAAAGEGSVMDARGVNGHVPEQQFVPADNAVVGRDRHVYVNGVDARNSETVGRGIIDPLSLLAAASDAYVQLHQREYREARAWVMHTLPTLRRLGLAN